MLKNIMVLVVVLFCASVDAQRMKQESKGNPDSDFDLKVDTAELKTWTGNISFYYNQGYADTYFGEQLKKFVASFDEDRNGQFSNLEFRRFQTGSRKLFSDATNFLTEKYDENKNRRLDKEEKEAVRTEIRDFLRFSLSLLEAKNSGQEAKTVLEKERALDDIYD